MWPVFRWWMWTGSILQVESAARSNELDNFQASEIVVVGWWYCVLKKGRIQNAYKTAKKKIRNGSLEFKDIYTRDRRLRVISIKKIFNSTRIDELTQAGVGKSKKGSQLRKLRETGQQSRRNQEIVGYKSPRRFQERKRLAMLDVDETWSSMSTEEYLRLATCEDLDKNS